jgi:3'-5' exoribonuclease
MAGAARLWIKDLRPGSEVDEVYAVRTKELRQRRGGGRYLALTLGDRSGQVTALAWEDLDRIGTACDVGSVARVCGQVQRYNQSLQVIVRAAAAVPAGEADATLFVRASAVDPELLWSRLMALIGEVADPHLKQLLYRILADPDDAARFRSTPAARTMHHAFRSGLLEHTVSSATAARLLARHYHLCEDLVVAGAILHDLGKIWELEADVTIEYSDDGRLLGHLTLGVLRVEQALGELPRFPAETRRHLLHILLSHHGEYEYGSPRRPKTPEALLVALVDGLDAKLAGMLEAIASGGATGEAWTEYSKILERPVYRRRPPTGGSAEE